MLKKRMVWILTIAFLFPIYSYADSTTVPDFNSVQECQTWVKGYADNLELKGFYDMDFHDWLHSFAVSTTSYKTKCVNRNCTIWKHGDLETGLPNTGGCDMIGYPPPVKASVMRTSG